MSTEHTHDMSQTTEQTVPPAEQSQDVLPSAAESPEPAEGVSESPEGTSAVEETAEEPVTDHPMDHLAAESLELKRFRRGEMVEGTIVARTEKEIIIDIGGKSEGIVPADDFTHLPPEVLEGLQVGKRVVAYVLNPETPDGHTLLSLTRAQMEADWRRAQAWMEEGRTVEAPVVDVNRGGLVVRFGLLRGFVPASHVERRPDMDPQAPPAKRLAPLKGQTLKLKIIEVDRNRRRLVLSEREAVREEREAARERLLAELEPGQVRRGRVKSLAKFGAFVDLGGLDGLVHISELSWKHVQHPSEVVQVGDEVEVYVLNVDREAGRVGLSLRRLQPKPWDTVLERYAIGQVVEGEVTKIVPFGAFVRLEDGIEGLVHVSELADRYVAHPREVVKEGDRVQVRILNIDPQAKRMGLSIKQAREDAYIEVDWEEAEDEAEVDPGLWQGLVEASPPSPAPDEAPAERPEEEA